MKLTRHNGRIGKNGVYNPKHNDRQFDIDDSDHIDLERAKGNVYSLDLPIPISLFRLIELVQEGFFQS